MVTFDVSLLRQHSPDEHTSLASYNVEVQPTDTDPIKRLEDAARSHINQRFASLGVTYIEHFLVRGMCSFPTTQHFIIVLAGLGAAPKNSIGANGTGSSCCEGKKLGL